MDEPCSNNVSRNRVANTPQLALQFCTETLVETFCSCSYPVSSKKLMTPPFDMAEGTPSKNHCGVTKVPAQLHTVFASLLRPVSPVDSSKHRIWDEGGVTNPSLTMYPETGWQILRLFGTASVIAATAQETFVTVMYKITSKKH